MRPVFVGIAVCVLGLIIWIGTGSWRWTHTDMDALFRARIASEIPTGADLSITPGTIMVGDLSETARLVCGTASGHDPSGQAVTRIYSLVVVKTLFGHSINDGFTPATRPDNQALSDENCAALRAHDVAHASPPH